MDKDVQLKWLNEVLVPWRDARFGLKSSLLLMADACGNVRAKMEDACKEENITLLIGPANRTAKWQPFDAGVGKTLKDVMYADGLDAWLKQSKNMRLWLSKGKKKGFQAQDKRILTLRWLSAAMAKLHTEAYRKLHEHCWHATGCALTADGSLDGLVRPQGMPEYSMPAP